MEAPEKLYFGKSDLAIFDTYSVRESDDEIEYTRTDVFIERACEFLNSSSILRSTHIVEWFKKYMKGEKL